MPLDYSDILKSFIKEKIEFTVIGGFAAVAHGVVRVTMDLDLALILNATNLEKTWSLCEKMGFIIRQPLSKEQFIDPKKLKEIADEKDAKAISFIHKKQNYLVIDILFNQEFQFSDKDIVDLNLFGVKCPVLGVEKLIELKLAAGIEKDLEDVRELKKIKKK